MTDDYKKKYYNLIKAFCILEANLKNDRCPSQWLGRNCCGACKVLREKIIKIKKDEDDPDLGMI